MRYPLWIQQALGRADMWQTGCTKLEAHALIHTRTYVGSIQSRGELYQQTLWVDY
jgi:hypothetical protein